MSDVIIKNVAALSRDQLVEVVVQLSRHNGAMNDLYGRFLDELRSIDFEGVFAGCAVEYERARQQLSDGLIERLKAIAATSKPTSH